MAEDMHHHQAKAKIYPRCIDTGHLNTQGNCILITPGVGSVTTQDSPGMGLRDDLTYNYFRIHFDFL